MPEIVFVCEVQYVLRQLTNPVRDCPILSHMSRMRPQSSAVFISLVAFSAGKKHNNQRKQKS